MPIHDWTRVSAGTWHDWQAELTQKLERGIAFLYGNFVRGGRRVVIDGVDGDRVQPGCA